VVREHDEVLCSDWKERACTYRISPCSLSPSSPRRHPTELLVAWPYAPEQLASVIRPGATVRRLRPGNYEVLGTAKVTGFAPFDRPRPEHLEMIRKAWPRNPAGRGGLFRLTLAEPLSAGRDRGLDVREVIDVRHARDAEVTANEVAKTGEAPPAP
jgi:hypothetical protein